MKSSSDNQAYMSHIHTVAQAEERFIHELASVDPYSESHEARLAYSKEFFAVLGDPQESFPAIHVTGTAGKGSTTYYTSALLNAQGFRVGTIVSPHVRDVRERAMVDLEFVEDEAFVAAARDTLDAANEMAARGKRKPGLPETYAGLGFKVCQNAGVDYGAVEVLI